MEHNVVLPKYAFPLGADLYDTKFEKGRKLPISVMAQVTRSLRIAASKLILKLNFHRSIVSGS